MPDFSEFKTQNYAGWREQLEKDLKGLSFESLVWHNENGFDVEPYYTASQLTQKYEPAFFHHDWQISVKVEGKEAKGLNVHLLKMLGAGASAFELDLGVYPLAEILQDVQLSYIQSSFVGGKTEAENLKNFLQNQYKNETVGFSFFGRQLLTGEDLNELILSGKILFPLKGCRGLGLDLMPYHNAGATASFELALAFSALAELYDRDPDVLMKAPVLKLGVSSDYFTEIAKLRAARRLWMMFKGEFNCKEDLYIIAETSAANKTFSDAYNNLLRSTVEAMAAVAGGCNELIVNSYELFHRERSQASMRLAINQQLILKEECYLDKYADVSCGSYYVESLTDLLAKKALDLFREMENLGGLVSLQEKGWVKEQIRAQSENKVQALQKGGKTVVGLNKFLDPKSQAAPPAALSEMAGGKPVLSVELENLSKSRHA